MKKNLKMFNGIIPFGDQGVYLSCNPIATELQLN